MQAIGPDTREDGLRVLREIRLRRGLSQADLSAMTGVAEFTISEIESGKRANPRPSTLRKLAQALNVEVADLLREGQADPLGEALSSQERLFNGVSEREAFIKRVRAYVETRVARYEKRLSEAEAGTFFAGYEGARALLDDALDEFMNLPDLVNGELADRWMRDPEVPEDVKVALGRAVGEVMLKPFTDVLDRIGSREKELAKTEAQRQGAEKHLNEIERWRQRRAS